MVFNLDLNSLIETDILIFKSKLFQSFGAQMEKALSPNIVLDLGMQSWWSLEDLKLRDGAYISMSSER